MATVEDIHLLAHDISLLHAREIAQIKRAYTPQRGRYTAERRRAAVASAFDPHAATELAELIERRLFPHGLAT